jgi:hypothetical protein
MNEIYKKVLEKALPYYKKADRGTKHVIWLFKTIPKFIKESEIDFDILILLAILHDVGYANVPKGSNPYKLNIRKLHSKEGAEIAEKILKNLKYPKKKIAEIKRLILKHDNWVFGDSFKNEPILRIFNIFDFVWMASPEGFESAMKYLKKDPKELFEHIKCQEKNIKKRDGWLNKKEIKKYFKKDIEEYYNKLMQKR